jgi:hypothetical protein
VGRPDDRLRVPNLGSRWGTARRTRPYPPVFVTVLLDMLAIGIIIAVLPKLVVDLVGGMPPRVPMQLTPRGEGDPHGRGRGEQTVFLVMAGLAASGFMK